MTIMCRIFYCSGGGVAHQQEQEAPCSSTRASCSYAWSDENSLPALGQDVVEQCSYVTDTHHVVKVAVGSLEVEPGVVTS